MPTPGPQNNDPNADLGMWRVLTEARKAVPAVDYALGLAGIAAAAAIIGLFVGHSRASIIILALVFIGMIMLFLFAKMSRSESPSTHQLGVIFLWVVLGFIVIFMGFTVSAFAFGGPSRWAAFLGITP